MQSTDPLIDRELRGHQKNANRCDKGLGIPSAKPLFYTTDLLALVTSLICFSIAVCTVTPRLKFSWQLGSELQIVVLGFLLGVMALCTQAVVPTLLLVLETKFGKSKLQNYQAIMTLRYMSSHISIYWRTVLFIFTILPVGLGVAYKRFDGGFSTISIASPAFSNPNYGLAYPPLGEYARMNNSIYELMNCNAGLWSIYSNDSLVPKSEDYPAAVGYNMALLDSSATALLDMPTQDYLIRIRSNMRASETWEISASVYATVARKNDTLRNLLTSDDRFFNKTFNAPGSNSRPFNAYFTYRNATNLGMFPIVVGGTANVACMLGFYNTTNSGIVMNLNINLDDSDIAPFRKSADVFSLTREKCTAKWRIDTQKVVLLKGACDPETSADVSQDVLKFVPYGVDTLPVLTFALQDIRSDSPWRNQTFAAAVTSSYWARATYMIRDGSNTYPSMEEQIYSSVVTLHASWSLYLVLSVQPALVITALTLMACLHSTPIGRGFGLISILAGVDPGGLSVLQRAGFSGEMIKSVTLKTRIRVKGKDQSLATEQEPTRYCIEYHIGSGSGDDGISQQVKRKEVYE